MRASVLSIIVFAAMVAYAGPALAYLDPFTGSAILQLTLGALVGLSVAAKLYWMKIKDFFLRLSAKEPGGDGDRPPK